MYSQFWDQGLRVMPIWVLYEWRKRMLKKLLYNNLINNFSKYSKMNIYKNSNKVLIKFNYNIKSTFSSCSI